MSIEENDGVRYVSGPVAAPLTFSVCSLVASQEKYDRVLRTFRANGFTPDRAEFIAVDNRNGNTHDGYDSLRNIFPLCQGEFILFTHDDIELIEQGADDLERILRRLTDEDPNWMIAGNAGWTDPRDGEPWHPRHLNDPHGEGRLEGEPVKVKSLDENFLVFRRNTMVFPSIDLDGFHLFATDMCIQAEMAGGSAYVIPFLMNHHSGGTASPAFHEGAGRVVGKYDSYLAGRTIRTPSTILEFGELHRQGNRVKDTVKRAEKKVRRGLGLDKD